MFKEYLALFTSALGSGIAQQPPFLKRLCLCLGLCSEEVGMLWAFQKFQDSGWPLHASVLLFDWGLPVSNSTLSSL